MLSITVILEQFHFTTGHKSHTNSRGKPLTCFFSEEKQNTHHSKKPFTYTEK